MSNWTTIESDPGVFTELIEDLGVRGVQVEELYTLDPEQFADLGQVFGLVFLFKYDPALHSDQTSSGTPAPDADLFFAKQVINNACATQAILSILLNQPHLELGSTLSEFREFTSDFPPELKGLAISNSDAIRTAHNSFASPEPFVIEHRQATKDDDVYHFAAYVPANGRVYELDGLRESPIDLGPSTSDKWLEVATPVIQQQIEKYASSEIRFNLLAVVKNKVDSIRHDLDHASNEMERNELKLQLAREEQKRQEWRDENKRRKHNYLPFVIQLLKTLAKRKELDGLIQQQTQATPQ